MSAVISENCFGLSVPLILADVETIAFPNLSINCLQKSSCTIRIAAVPSSANPVGARRLV